MFKKKEDDGKPMKTLENKEIILNDLALEYTEITSFLINEAVDL